MRRTIYARIVYLPLAASATCCALFFYSFVHQDYPHPNGFEPSPTRSKPVTSTGGPESQPEWSLRFSWYGPTLYPVVPDDHVEWKWILTFLESIPDRKGDDLKWGVKTLRTALLRPASTGMLSVRYPSVDISSLEEELFTKGSKVKNQRRTLQLTRDPCRSRACERDSQNGTSLNSSEKRDVFIFNAHVMDLYDVEQRIAQLSCAKLLVTSITTESWEQAGNDRYADHLYDFLNKIYFVYDWIPVAVDFSSRHSAGDILRTGQDGSHQLVLRADPRIVQAEFPRLSAHQAPPDGNNRFAQQFWIIWTPWNKKNNLDYFPPAAHGSSAYELQRLATFWTHPIEDQCFRREAFGGNLTGTKVGRVEDGRYTICMDDFPKPADASSCLVYSFGVRDDWTFDDAMHDAGCSVFSFDPSTDDEDHQRAENHYFYKWGLKVDSKLVNSTWKMFTVEETRERLNHETRTINVLKMDAEGGEFALLQSPTIAKALKNVDQILMEIHYSPKLFDWKGAETIRDMSKAMHILEKLGFVLFYSHSPPHYKDGPETWGPDLRAYDRSWSPDGSQSFYYELSFVRRKTPSSRSCG